MAVSASISLPVGLASDQPYNISDICELGRNIFAGNSNSRLYEPIMANLFITMFSIIVFILPIIKVIFLF